MNWNMNTQDYQFVFWHKRKVFLQPIQLMLLHPSIIIPFLTQVTHIVHYHVMNLPPVERIVSGTISLLEGVIGSFIPTLAIIHIMIAQALEKRNTHLCHRSVVIIKQLQLIPYNITNGNTMYQCARHRQQPRIFLHQGLIRSIIFRTSFAFFTCGSAQMINSCSLSSLPRAVKSKLMSFPTFEFCNW